MSTSYIHRLPDEITIFIIELGCQLDWNLSHKFGTSHPYPMQHNTCKTINRRPKPIPSTMLQVCSRWKSVVDSCSQFWTTQLYLCQAYDNDVINDLVVYRQALLTSQGSDIDIVWKDDQTTYFDDETDEYKVKLRIFLHAMAMAKPYFRQWRTIIAELFHPETVMLLFSMLNEVGPTPNLVGLFLNQMTDQRGPDIGVDVSEASRFQQLDLHVSH